MYAEQVASGVSQQEGRCTRPCVLGCAAGSQGAVWDNGPIQPVASEDLAMAR